MIKPHNVLPSTIPADCKPPKPDPKPPAIKQILIKNNALIKAQLDLKVDKTDIFTKAEIIDLIPDVSKFVTQDTKDLTNYYTKDDTDNLFKNKFMIKIVETLPEIAEDGIIYLLKEE